MNPIDFLKRHNILYFAHGLYTYDVGEKKEKKFIHLQQCKKCDYLLNNIELGRLSYPTQKSFHLNTTEDFECLHNIFSQIDKNELLDLINKEGLKKYPLAINPKPLISLSTDTRVIAQLDNDDTNGIFSNLPFFEELKKTCPYHKSMTKGNEKFFIIPINMPPDFEKKSNYHLFKNENGVLLEIQQGRQSYVNPLDDIENGNMDIPSIDVTQMIKDIEQQSGLTSVLKPTTTKTTKSKENYHTPSFYGMDKLIKIVLDQLDSSYFDSYDSWFKIGTVIKTYVEDENEGLSLFQHYSKRSCRYNEKDWVSYGSAVNNFNNFKKGACHINYILNLLEESDPKYYDWIFKKKVFYLIQDILRNSTFDYLTTKYLFEIHHFKVQQPPVYVVQSNDNEIVEYPSLLPIYNNLWYKGKTDEMYLFIRKWEKDQQIRCYHKLIFCPLEHTLFSKREFNCFKGLDASFLPKPTEPHPYLKDILTFIKDRLCDGNEEYYNYHLKWLAFIVKHPGKKTGVNNICKGGQGVGKNMFYEWFGNCVIGRKYTLITDRPADVVGKFNGLLLNKLFILLDEVCGKDTFSSNEGFKSKISNPTMTIERKGKDQKSDVPNYLNFMSLTNQNCPYKIEATDRKFCGIETTIPRLTDKECLFFGNEIFSQQHPKLDIISSFYYYLIEDVEIDINFEIDKPSSNFYKDCKLLSCPTIYSFLAHFIELPEQPKRIRASSLYQIYKEWNSEQNSNKPLDTYRRFTTLMNGFGNCIVKEKDQSFHENKKVNHLYYNIDYDILLKTLEQKGAIENIPSPRLLDV